MNDNVYIRLNAEDLSSDIRIALLGIDNLKLHEEIIPSNAIRLLYQIRLDNILYNSIIVSEKRKIILDGTRRIWVFKKLEL